MSKPKREIKYFSEGEIARFFRVLDSGKNVRDRLLFRFLYHYGLRINEAVGIRLEDIKPDLLRPVEIEVRRLKGGQGRHYPVRPEDAKLLASWLRKRGKLKNSEGNPFLFITSRSASSHMTDVLLKKLHQKHCELAVLPKEKGTNPHAWRHTCAISLLMAGKDINFVKSYLGHRSIRSTLIYAEIAPPEWKKLSTDAVLNSFPV